MDVDVGQQDWSTVLPVGELSNPENWQDNGFAMLLGAALFGASGVASGLTLVRSVDAHDLLTAIISLGSVIFCLCVMMVIVRIKYIAPPLRASFNAAGTTLRPDRTTLVLIFILDDLLLL